MGYILVVAKEDTALWSIGIYTARDGHVALTGELDLAKGRDFTLALAFGESQHTAVTTLLAALAVQFVAHAARYAEQWARPGRTNQPLETAATDGGHLIGASVCLLHAHEDKTCPGTLIASLSIQWGEAQGDEDQGGYHLVWTRDMVQSATALLAVGHEQVWDEPDRPGHHLYHRRPTAGTAAITRWPWYQ